MYYRIDLFSRFQLTQLVNFFIVKTIGGSNPTYTKNLLIS